MSRPRAINLGIRADCGGLGEGVATAARARKTCHALRVTPRQSIGDISTMVEIVGMPYSAGRGNTRYQSRKPNNFRRRATTPDASRHDSRAPFPNPPQFARARPSTVRGRDIAEARAEIATLRDAKFRRSAQSSCSDAQPFDSLRSLRVRFGRRTRAARSLRSAAGNCPAGRSCRPTASCHRIAPSRSRRA